MEPGQSLVHILRRVIEAMIVVPECAKRLPWVAIRSEPRIGEPGEHVGIVLVPEEPRIEEVTREAVAFRRGVAIVKMGGGLRYTKSPMICGKVIMHANQNWFPVFRMVRRARKPGRAAAICEAPYGLERQVGMETL